MRDESHGGRLARDVGPLVAQKRACGYPYVGSATILRRFDRMVAERFPDDTAVTRGACDAWLSLAGDEHPNEPVRRVSPVRQLARHVAASGRPSHMMPSGIPGRRPERQARVLAPGEPSASLGAAGPCRPSACPPARERVVPTPSGMPCCCGMRSSEALLLDANGAGLETGRIDTRGREGWRGRTTCMGDDMLRVRGAYDDAAGTMLPGRTPPFPNREGGFFSRHAPNRWSRRSWDPPPEAAHARGNPPRARDLGHARAVTRPDGWVGEGADIEATCPCPGGLLGHASLPDTSYYLRMSASSCPGPDRRMAPVNLSVLPEVVRHGEEGRGDEVPPAARVAPQGAPARVWEGERQDDQILSAAGQAARGTGPRGAGGRVRRDGALRPLSRCRLRPLGLAGGRARAVAADPPACARPPQRRSCDSAARRTRSSPAPACRYRRPARPGGRARLEPSISSPSSRGSRSPSRTCRRESAVATGSS